MKFKKLLTLGMAALMAVAVTAGCGSDKAADKGGAALPKKIVVGLDDNFPPMGFRDDKGQLVGFDIDLAKEAAKRLGIEVEFKPIDWNSKEAELKSKHIDVLWNGLTIMEERKKNILFSVPYLKDEQIIITRADSTIKNKQDLAGKVVGTQQGSTAASALAKDPFSKEMKQVKEYADFVNAFTDLELGRLDAMIVDSITGRYLMAKKPDVYKVAEGNYGSDPVAVGMRKEDTKLKEAIDKVILDMQKDGTMEKAAKQWFGSDAPVKNVENK